MLRAGIIVPSGCPCALGIAMVKQEERTRRSVNSVSKIDLYPLPCINDVSGPGFWLILVLHFGPASAVKADQRLLSLPGGDGCSLYATFLVFLQAYFACYTKMVTLPGRVTVNRLALHLHNFRK